MHTDWTHDDDANDPAAGGSGNGRKKKKKKKASKAKKAGASTKSAGTGRGRGRRGPAGQTVEKQLWVIEQLQANPGLTIHELMQMVRTKFKTMLSFDRTKEAKAAYHGGAKAIEQLRKGEFKGGGGGRGGRGSTLTGSDAPQYMVASKKRSRWQFEAVANEREANRRVQELVSQGESPAVYRRADLKVDVRIGR